ncbi:hypothetical protein [Nocardioides daphniae]|uniref:Uncharacterized protein n=1 Tax=Nocardioides daphniae TaxID=402297 RepID=A0A4P7U7X4_9ACTN|nr:hypothetical protein [Nocardioides daphniae]QCC76283.1 hypothetical protein E2C04_01970 [Nocardioides daphniae]GGD08316.1 hypothetical protein GCM10007231_03920 [Nocardioides daphniae]
MEKTRALRRTAIVAGVCVFGGLLLVAALVWWEVREPHARVVDDRVEPGGWKTLAYESVEVDVPGDWQRLDMDDCEWQFERWAPPGTDPCAPDAVGVAFYGSATFDAAVGPDVITAGDDGQGGESWSGCAYAGDFAVNASTPDRATTRRILDSAR